MTARLFWIDAPVTGALAIAARPRAGDWLEDEIAAWRRDGVGAVVSLLDAEEIAELGLQEEHARCEAAGLAFLSFPIPDRAPPDSLAKTQALVEDIERRLASGEGVAIHCRAGIGRSATIAACVLIALGLSPHDAFTRIAAARGVEVPDTQKQREFAALFAAARERPAV
jgi:protein-tyrosine phosphatase